MTFLAARPARDVGRGEIPQERKTYGRTCILLPSHKSPLGQAHHLEEGNAMQPFYTLLLCLPAALVLIACGCGVAVLWPPEARPADHPMVGRPRGGQSAL